MNIHCLMIKKLKIFATQTVDIDPALSVNPYNMFANYAKSHSDQNPIFKFIWNIDVNNQVYKFLEQKYKLIVLTGYIKQTNNNNNNSWIMGICIIYFSYDFFEFWFFWFLCVLILSKRGIWYI